MVEKKLQTSIRSAGRRPSLSPDELPEFKSVLLRFGRISPQDKAVGIKRLAKVIREGRHGQPETESSCQNATAKPDRDVAGRFQIASPIMAGEAMTLGDLIEQPTDGSIELVGGFILAAGNLGSDVGNPISTNLRSSRLGAHDLSFRRQVQLVNRKIG